MDVVEFLVKRLRYFFKVCAFFEICKNGGRFAFGNEIDAFCFGCFLQDFYGPDIGKNGLVKLVAYALKACNDGEFLIKELDFSGFIYLNIATRDYRTDGKVFLVCFANPRLDGKICLGIETDDVDFFVAAAGPERGKIKLRCGNFDSWNFSGEFENFSGERTMA